jgi:hypothetical protein
MLLLVMRGDNNQIVKHQRVVVAYVVGVISKFVLSVQMQSFCPVSENFNVFTFRDQNLSTNFVSFSLSLSFMQTAGS